MNLLNKYINIESNKINDDVITINNFRKKQYENLNIYLETIFEFLQKISNGRIILSRIESSRILKYSGINGSKIKLIEIYIKDPEDESVEKKYISFYIPELVDDNFFYITGCTYCPALYILDYPIVYKSFSIKLTGLINSITIFLKSGSARAIFGGKNIPIQYFLQYFLYDNQDLINKIYTKYKIESIKHNEDTILSYFADIFNCRKDRNVIDQIFNDLFFDSYTSALYYKCYNRNFEFNELVEYVLTQYLSEEEPTNFVDLHFKRLIFIEQLLYPLFKKIGEVSFNIVRGYKTDEVIFSESEIIRFFTINLKHQFFYDLVNLYSGISISKASFMNPNSTTAPKEISSIHESHFGKICPATVSAQKPGETVSIVPGTTFDMFGRFFQ